MKESTKTSITRKTKKFSKKNNEFLALVLNHAVYFLYIIVFYYNTNIFLDLDEIQAKEVAISSISIEKRLKVQRNALLLEDIGSFIFTYYKKCPYHLLYSTTEDDRHSLSTCTRGESRAFQQEVYRFRDRLRTSKSIASYTACFHCFLPQDYCRRWLAKRDGGFERDNKVKECTFPDFLLSFLIVGLSIPEYLSGYIDRLKDEDIERGSREELLYLGRKMEICDTETNFLFIKIGYLSREFKRYLEEERII